MNTRLVVKTLIQQRDITLNGGARASVGGKSRTVIPIQLPENTKTWYYSFSTSPGESGIENLNLALQLSSILIDPSGITKAAISGMKIPQGSGTIDACVFDRQNSDLFLAKADYNGTAINHLPEGYAFNTRQAIIDINSAKEGTFYIGLRNPSSLEGVNIRIEVVALIEEVEEQTEDQTQAFTLGELAWKAFERDDYTQCLELSKKAVSLDKSLSFVYFNIALTYLIKGQNTDAIEEYAKAIAVARKSVNPEQALGGAIGDLKNYMDKFPSKSDAQNILEMLNQEVDKH